MDPLDLNAKWNVLKSKLRIQYPDWVLDDIVYKPGNQEDFYKKLAEKTGKTKQEIISLLKELDLDD